MIIEIDRDAMRGDLPDAVFRTIEWERLAWFTREAILAQNHNIRKDILDSEMAGLEIIRPKDLRGALSFFGRIADHPLCLPY